MIKSLKGQLLVASPQLLDPNFFRTVVLIVQHGEQGALGLVLNRPTETSVNEAWQQIDEEEQCDVEGVIHQGGPCEGPLMLVHDNRSFSDVEVGPGLFFSTEREEVHQLVALNKGKLKFFVGYAGWTAGQLEKELKDGGWLVTPALSEIVFGDTDDQWTWIVKEVTFRALYPGMNPKLIPLDPSMN